MKNSITITRIILEKDGIEYSARPATNEELRTLEEKIKETGNSTSCSCGQEMCLEGWVWRCMAAGGGECIWYITNIVC